MKLPSLRGIGDYLSAHRQAVLIILSIIELLILLILILRWFDRRFGLRGTLRRIGRGIAGLGRDLVAPIVKAVRFRRRARIIALRIAAADPWATASAALGSASAVLGEHEEHWPYLASLGAGTVTVTIAGPGVLPPPEAEVPVWRTKSGRSWTAALPVPLGGERPELPAPSAGERPELPAPSAGDRPKPPAPSAGERPELPLPIAVGILGDELVLVDLARSPGIISVHGAPAPVDQLVSAMTAQLMTAVAGGTVDRLLITEQVLPGAEVTPLPEALAALQARPAGGVKARAVLVCDHPDAEAAARIAVLAARDPGLLVLVAGYLPGSRWRLRVNTAGQVSATELSLEADSRPLWRGMELAGQARAAAGPMTANRPDWPASPLTPAGPMTANRPDWPADPLTPAGPDRPTGPETPPPPRRIKAGRPRIPRIKPVRTGTSMAQVPAPVASVPGPAAALPDWADEATVLSPADDATRPLPSLSPRSGSAVTPPGSPASPAGPSIIRRSPTGGSSFPPLPAPPPVQLPDTPGISPYAPPAEQTAVSSGPGPLWQEPTSPAPSGPGPIWREPTGPAWQHEPDGSARRHEQTWRNEPSGPARRYEPTGAAGQPSPTGPARRDERTEPAERPDPTGPARPGERTEPAGRHEHAGPVGSPSGGGYSAEDDLIEPTTAPDRPMARSGAEGDTAPTRSGD